MEEPPRLTPAMSSRKRQVLDVIKRYYLEQGESPTLGEIAARLGISRQRAHAVVGRLALEGHVRRVKGRRRGIMLLDPAKQVSETDALLQLQTAGWRIDVTTRAVAGMLTETRLPLAPVLDHIPIVETGVGNAARRKRRRGGSDARHHRARKP